MPVFYMGEVHHPPRSILILGSREHIYLDILKLINDHIVNRIM
jgi:hypothetical protein